MAKEILIIGIKGCPGCDRVKKAIDNGELDARYLDGEQDQEAIEIIEKLRPYYAPFCVVKKGGEYKECKLKFENGKFEIEEGEGGIEIE